MKCGLLRLIEGRQRRGAQQAFKTQQDANQPGNAAAASPADGATGREPPSE